ncbi:MAG TPA: rhomboid family intramembrane serine protease, partial [Homoserinimonas sp.]|nr:rhomboid family intramembrane serine protease [Homoserinimonas sp.]
YRHPDRESYVLCQRCGRTVCGECQTQAAVGVHCPECRQEARKSAPRTKPALVTAINRARHGGGPVVTYSLLAINVVVYLLQQVTGGAVTEALAYHPVLTTSEPWRMLTSTFVHSQGSIFHILFNGYALWLFGRMLEPALGPWRFLTLYLLSGLGGSAAVLWLSPGTWVVGASGAVFGLFAAMFVIQRGLGGNATQLLIVIGLNLVIGFIPGSNISWQAHLGGLIVGALVALVLMKTRSPRQAGKQRLLLLGVLILLVVTIILGAATLVPRLIG